MGRLEHNLPGAWIPPGEIARPFPEPKSVADVREVGRLPPGLLEVCSVGGDGRYCVIFSGTARGQVWVTNEEDDWSPAVNEEWLLSHPELDSLGFLELPLRTEREQRFEFADWLDDWLDASLRAASRLAERKHRAEPGAAADGGGT